MLAESSKSAPKAVLCEGIQLVEKVFDIPSVTDGDVPFPFWCYQQICCVKEMLAESSKSAPKAIFYEGIGPAEKVFYLYFLMDAELPLTFDVANKFIVKQMLAESSKSVPKALLYEGIELVKKVFDVLSVTVEEDLFSF